MKKLSSSALLLASLAISSQAIANDYSVTIKEKPHRMLVLSAAGGLSEELFSVLSRDVRHIPFR